MLSVFLIVLAPSFCLDKTCGASEPVGWPAGQPYSYDEWYRLFPTGSAGNSSSDFMDTFKILSNRRNDLRYLTLSSKMAAALHPKNKSKSVFDDNSLHVSFIDAVKSSPKYGDILTISNLKKQLNQRLKIIAKFMNNSYGIVMQKVKRKRRNRTEIRLQWIINQEIKAGIKLKYLTKAFPNIYFHRMPDECSNDWLYVSNVCRLLLENDKNIIVNQLSNVSMMSHPNIMRESLIVPSMAKYEMMYDLNCNDVSQIISFLCQMPYFLSPSAFQEVINKLYASKVVRIKSVRTKLLPLLRSLYTELSIMYHDAFNATVSHDNDTNYPLVALDVWRNQSETIILREMKLYLFAGSKRYSSFFAMLKKCVLQMLHQDMGSKNDRKRSNETC